VAHQKRVKEVIVEEKDVEVLEVIAEKNQEKEKNEEHLMCVQETQDKHISEVLAKIQELYGSVANPEHEPRVFEHQVAMAQRVLTESKIDVTVNGHVGDGETTGV